MLPNPNTVGKVYTLKRGSKTVSLVHKSVHYVIGFNKTTLARKVMYNLHPEPEFTLVRDNGISLGPDLLKAGFVDLELNIDVGATLFIPKCKGDILHPLNDGGYHLSYVAEDDFLMYPVSKNLGIVMPTEIFDEDNDEYVFKAFVMDPTGKL